MKCPRLDDYPDASAWIQAWGAWHEQLVVEPFPSDRSKWTYRTPHFEPYTMKRGNWTGD